MCDFAIDDIVNVLETEIPDPPFNTDESELFISKVFYGAITTSTLDPLMYGKTINYLMDATIGGFGGFADDFVFGTAPYNVGKGLEENIWRFSAAKQYQQVRIMSNLSSAGVDWPTFNRTARIVFDDYNVNYLKSEWITSTLQAQQAREWVDFQDNEEIELLTYHTQRDGRVRPAHRSLDGITRPKNDPFWHDYSPSNGWRCRCFLTGKKIGKTTDLARRNIPEFGTKEFPKEFKMNPGKDKLIFKSNHPYFNIKKGDAGLKRNNFNLPLPPR